jgi:hypothetical protein
VFTVFQTHDSKRRHVRSIEVWRDRFSIDEWRVFAFEGLSEERPVTPSLRSHLTDRELGSYSEKLSEYLPGLEGISSSTLIKADEDGGLKALLMATLPRLKNVKFITSQHDRGSTLYWLDKMISKNQWPTVFSNLQSIAVGIPSDTWLDPSDSPVLPFYLLVSLLRIPDIYSIYVNNFHCQEGDDMTIDLEDLLSAETSEVRHIFFDNCNIRSQNCQVALSAAPYWLESIAFRFDAASETRPDSVEDIFMALSDDQGSTLESMMFYATDPGIQAVGRPYYPPFHFSTFSRMDGVLKNFSLDWEEVAMQAISSQDFWRDLDGWISFIRKSYWFPENMETIVIHGRVVSVDQLELFVLGLMGCGEFPRLQAIHLEGLDIVRKTGEECFPEAIKMGKELGVKVHTLTTDVPKSTERFPRAPDKYDLVSGPYKGKRPEGFVFDVYEGREVPPRRGR